MPKSNFIKYLRMLWPLGSRVARCVLGFAVLNVMNAVICLDYCRYDKSILPRCLPKPLPSVWSVCFCVRRLAAYCFITRYLYSRQCALQSWTKIWRINRGKDLNSAFFAQPVHCFQNAEILPKDIIFSMQAARQRFWGRRKSTSTLKRWPPHGRVAELGSMIMFFLKQQKAYKGLFPDSRFRSGSAGSGRWRTTDLRGETILGVAYSAFLDSVSACLQERSGFPGSHFFVNTCDQGLLSEWDLALFNVVVTICLYCIYIYYILEPQGP